MYESFQCLIFFLCSNLPLFAVGMKAVWINELLDGPIEGNDEDDYSCAARTVAEALKFIFEELST